MRTTRFVLLLALSVVCLTPAPAFAHVGWWDWLDDFSGPGPFGNGWTVDFRLACRSVNVAGASPDALGQNTKWQLFTQVESERVSGRKRYDCRSDSTAYVEIRAGSIKTVRQALFQDVPTQFVGTASAQNVQAYLMHKMKPLSIGVGGGWMWFSGEHVLGRPGRLTLTPISIAFTPLSLVLKGTHKASADFITVRFEEIAVLGGLEAGDFNPASTSSFHVKSDLVSSVSVAVDFLALWK